MTQKEIIKELDKRDRQKTKKIGELSSKIHALLTKQSEKLNNYDKMKDELVRCKKKITTLENKLNRIKRAVLSS